MNVPESSRSRDEATGAWTGLHVLADDDPRWTIDPVEQARAACEGGARVVQLRAKHGVDSQILEWGRAIRTLTRDVGARFVVNDRFDLALATQADAVHLGQHDMPPASLPVAVRRRLAVGRSTHTLQQARSALREQVDYVAFGPVFGTQSKRSEYSRRGAARLEEVARGVAPLPLIAVRGVSAGPPGRAHRRGRSAGRAH